MTRSRIWLDGDGGEFDDPREGGDQFVPACGVPSEGLRLADKRSMRFRSLQSSVSSLRGALRLRRGGMTTWLAWATSFSSRGPAIDRIGLPSAA